MKKKIKCLLFIAIIIFSGCYQSENKQKNALELKLLGVSDNYFKNRNLMEKTSYYTRRIEIYCRVYNKNNKIVFFPFNSCSKNSRYSSSLNLYINNRKLESYVHYNNVNEINPQDSISFSISFWIPNPDYYGIKRNETIESVANKIDIRYHINKQDRKFSKNNIYPISFKKKNKIIYTYRDSSTINHEIDWAL